MDGGFIPVETLPPANEEVIGREMTVNPMLEEQEIFFYYCRNEETKTERLALIMGDYPLTPNRISCPLLIVANVNFGSAEAFKTALEQKKIFPFELWQPPIWMRQKGKL